MMRKPFRESTPLDWVGLREWMRKGFPTPPYSHSNTIQYTLKVMCKSIPAASIPPGKLRAFDARWVPGPRHLAVNSVPAPRAFAISYQTTKSLLRNILLSFPTALGVKDFKQRHFGLNIKPFVLSLLSRSDSSRDLFLCSSIELKQLCLLKNGS